MLKQTIYDYWKISSKFVCSNEKSLQIFRKWTAEICVGHQLIHILLKSWWKEKWIKSNFYLQPNSKFKPHATETQTKEEKASMYQFPNVQLNQFVGD
jgi:hypothetical protein